MLRIYTDQLLKKQVAKIVKTDRNELWSALHDIGGYFALIGAIPESMSIWEFAYSGIVPLPDEEDRTISVFGDGAISAVRNAMRMPDLSYGIPKPSFCEPKQPLGNRINAAYLEVWDRITSNKWSAEALKDPKPELQPTMMFQLARFIAKRSMEEDSGDEALALEILKMLLDGKDFEFQLKGKTYRKTKFDLAHYDKAEAYLLVIEILNSLGRLSEAKPYLESWFDQVVKSYLSLEVGFGLVGVTKLICEGTLAHKSQMKEKTRNSLVKEIISTLKKRLNKPEPVKPTPTKYKLSISYNQFYLEPLEANREVIYFQENGEHEQGFSWFPEHVAIGTPSEAAQCTIEWELKEKMPPLGKAVQAVVVPYEVEKPGGVFLRTVDDSGKKQRFDVPVGKYDLLARFYPHPLKEFEDTCLTAWKVKLTFLPAGSADSKCIKLVYGKPPEKLVFNSLKKSPK